MEDEVREAERALSLAMARAGRVDRAVLIVRCAWDGMHQVGEALLAIAADDEAAASAAEDHIASSIRGAGGGWVEEFPPEPSRFSGDITWGLGAIRRRWVRRALPTSAPDIEMVIQEVAVRSRFSTAPA